jgi:type IV secretion system protein VirB6
MAVTFNFYEDTFTKLNGTLSTYVSDVAGNIIGAITPVATTLLMIYVMLWGWSMLRGMINEPITDGVTRLVRLAVIIGVALNLGRYNGYVSNFLWDSPDAIAGYIASGYSDSTTSVQFLDQLMGRIYDLGNAYWTTGMAAGAVMPDFGMIIIAILIWSAGIVSTAYGAFLLCLSKMGLAIILAVGPIFILLTIFEGTKRFFDVWLGQALNFVFTVMLTAAGIKLIMTIIDASLAAQVAAGALSEPLIPQAIPVIVLCLIAALVLIQVPSMASALGGGVALSTMGAVGWAYNKTAGAAKSGKDLVSGKTLSDMRAQRRAKQVNARWAERNPGTAAKVAGAPMAVYRKVTGANKNRVAKG